MITLSLCSLVWMLWPWNWRGDWTGMPAVRYYRALKSGVWR